MKIYNISEQKGDFFKVLGKTEHSQIATMTIEPGSDSGPENLHPGDQVVYVIEGEMHVTINDKPYNLTAGQLIQIPPQTHHQIKNKGKQDLFFLNIYTPPAY